MKKYLLEGIGTALLVFIACGVAAVTGADVVATSLAFGLTLFGLVLVIGPVSGCHVNPAVSFALALGKKITWKEFGFYVLAQFVGAVVGSLVLWAVVGNVGTGANGISSSILSAPYVDSAAALPTWGAALRALGVEVLLTCIFVGTILVVTTKYKKKLLIALAIGLTLTLVHLIGIPLTGTSVNPARSFGPALISLFQGNTEPIAVWIIFLVGPMLGALLASVLVKAFTKVKPAQCTCEECCENEHHEEEEKCCCEEEPVKKEEEKEECCKEHPTK